MIRRKFVPIYKTGTKHRKRKTKRKKNNDVTKCVHIKLFVKFRKGWKKGYRRKYRREKQEIGWTIAAIIMLVYKNISVLAIVKEVSHA